MEKVSLPPLRAQPLFAVPVWRSRIPQLFRHHAEMKRDILAAWEAGQYQRHRHGYGYQTQATIFYAENVERYPYFGILKQAFRQNVEQILRRRKGLSTVMPYRISAVVGWILLQTAEDWVSGTWHDHYPALISACYYLQVPETEEDTEAALAFQRPSPQDLFVEHVQRIRPGEGDFILFPSSLWHRPEPCPSAKELRISINMDAYVDWEHRRPEGGDAESDQSYADRLAESLD